VPAASAARKASPRKSGFPVWPLPDFHTRLLQATPFKTTDTKRLPGGQAATVAGHVGPGFHNWPPGHTPQNTDSNPLLRSRSTATEDPHTKQPRRRRRRHCSRVRWPRFPHLAPRPHPSKHGSESASTNPVSGSPHRRPRPIEPPTQRHIWASRLFTRRAGAQRSRER
jgi:hypothetical protein